VLFLALRLLHPFTPFITEELWGHLRRAVIEHFGAPDSYGVDLTPLHVDWAEALIITPWPIPRPEGDWEAKAVTEFSLVQEVVRAIRNLRSEKNVRPTRRLAAIFAAGDRLELLRPQSAILAALAGLDVAALTFVRDLPEKPVGHIALVVGAVEIYLPLAGMVDTSEEIDRLQKELAEVQKQIERLGQLLGSPFAQKAPPAVVNKERDKLEQFQQTAEKIRGQLEGMK
jgi:valyl-tRNA synthetase